MEKEVWYNPRVSADEKAEIEAVVHSADMYEGAVGIHPDLPISPELQSKAKETEEALFHAHERHELEQRSFNKEIISYIQKERRYSDELRKAEVSLRAAKQRQQHEPSAEHADAVKNFEHAVEYHKIILDDFYANEISELELAKLKAHAKDLKEEGEQDRVLYSPENSHLN